MGPIVVLASLMVASAILLEAALSFLGLGDPNLMSWGFMIGQGRSVIRLAWWMSVFPGIALFLTVLALQPRRRRPHRRPEPPHRAPALRA